MISTQDLSAMPDLASFARITRALAALDIIASPDWQYRYYAFDPAWGAAMMASMRNGSGDQWFAHVSAAGTALLGLSHESPAYRQDDPQPWVYADLPDVLAKDVRHEVAFEPNNVSFCVWRRTEDDRWHGQAPPDGSDDGSAGQLQILSGAPEHYVEFADDYYGLTVTAADVTAVYGHEEITEALVARINPEAVFADVAKELAEIGYTARTP